MSCDVNRRKLWNILGLNDKKMESIFYQAKRGVQKRRISKVEKEEWLEKTKRILALFDYYDIERPVHSVTGIPRLSSLAGFAAVEDAISIIEIPIFGNATGGLTKDEIVDGLTLLGQKAFEQGTMIRLLAVGGAALILAYSLKRATHDVDVYIMSPNERQVVRDLVQSVANEMDWTNDWLNEGAKGYIFGNSDGGVVFSSSGIEVSVPSPYQLLAMKLVAWRSSKDEMDAATLLQAIINGGLKDKDKIWNVVESFLIETYAVKARMAYEETWDILHGVY